MRTFAPLLLISSLVFVAILYLNAHYPDVLGEMKAALGQQEAVADAGGYSAKQQEQARLAKINALLISDINKRDLREGRPFWGAPAAMVELAFATEADSASLNMQEGVAYEFHSFRFPDQRGDVVAEFQDGKLSCMHYAADQNTICNTGRTSYYGEGHYPFTTASATTPR